MKGVAHPPIMSDDELRAIAREPGARLDGAYVWPGVWRLQASSDATRRRTVITSEHFQVYAAAVTAAELVMKAERKPVNAEQLRLAFGRGREEAA